MKAADECVRSIDTLVQKIKQFVRNENMDTTEENQDCYRY